MKIDFIPIDYDHFEFNKRDIIKVIGRTDKGKRLCLFDEIDSFFWVLLDKKLSKEKIKSAIKKIEKVRIKEEGKDIKAIKIIPVEKNFLGKPVTALKIFTKNNAEMKVLANKVESENFTVRGNDLNIITRYIIEKDLIPSYWYEVEGDILTEDSLDFGGIQKSLDVEFCLKLKKTKVYDQFEKSFNPKAVAFDIECDDISLGEGEILMISLASSEGFKKVLTWKKPSHGRKPEYVEILKDEKEMLEKFSEYVSKISPDFLVGYYSDHFDFPYIKTRAEKLKAKINLGIDGSGLKLTKGKNVAGKIKGIVHIDLLNFIDTAYSQYMQSETLSLNEVAKEFLGEEKVKFEFKHSSKMEDSEWEKYYEYNLHDSVLTIKLFEKMWPDLMEFSRVIQEPIFEVSRNGMSKNVESYILHNLKQFNEVPEKKPEHDELSERRNRERYEGAFVFEPIPGLYENIAMFDFTSSYGSVIVTYNLSKATLLEKPEKDAYSIETLGKKVYFSKKPGFLPEILKEIISKRKQFKKELKEKPDAIKKARSNAFKLLANSYYGYQGFFGARYYCVEAAAASAAFARKAIQEVIEKITKEKHKVIYSDTDSIAFLRGKSSHEEIKKLLEKINKGLPGIMELELEGFFKRGIWVTKRTGEIGAKKKYALRGEDGKLKIRGFETVRRDWCKLARDTQNRVIRLVLDEGNEKKALEYVKEVIKKLKERKIDKKEILIRTQLKKPLSEYKAISPHVIAARKMIEQEIPIAHGSLIEYYIAETLEKKKLVREKVKLPEEKGEYNLEYYLTKQILPSVENILQVFNVETKNLVEGKKQTTLGDF
ncbi:DNA polymerase [uncultured archaeon]|nr:DNA polymerase [uncultured archaeon]